MRKVGFKTTDSTVIASLTFDIMQFLDKKQFKIPNVLGVALGEKIYPS